MPGVTKWWMTTTSRLLRQRLHRPADRPAGVGGTNIKGHLIKFNYSIDDSLTFSFTAYINELINPNQNIGAAGEPKNGAIHVMADLMWKF